VAQLQPGGGGLIEELRRVCELQPQYAPENTEAMRERGALIRRALPASVKQFIPQLAAALGPFGGDVDVDASDGIGRKTQAPWFRIFSRSMSPTPRDGFYVVIHFAADGSAVFVTVGCGSTIWANGELRAVSDHELERRTSWARGVVVEAFGDLKPFVDEIVLGAKAPLPSTFEKATALARRIPVDALDDDMVRSLIIEATARLRVIYEAQRIGRDLTVIDLVERQFGVLAKTGRAGQGFGLSAPERRAVELRAMSVARAWLEKQGFAVRDTSANSPFDFEAVANGRALKVEVKGTTSDNGDDILMTRNEVELHRREAGQTGLLVVSRIRLERGAEGASATGGELFADLGWRIDAWELEPIAYRVRKPR